jgi:hypothetical protein
MPRIDHTVRKTPIGRTIQDVHHLDFTRKTGETTHIQVEPGSNRFLQDAIPEILWRAGEGAGCALHRDGARIDAVPLQDAAIPHRLGSGRRRRSWSQPDPDRGTRRGSTVPTVATMSDRSPDEDPLPPRLVLDSGRREADLPDPACPPSDVAFSVRDASVEPHRSTPPPTTRPTWRLLPAMPRTSPGGRRRRATYRPLMRRRPATGPRTRAPSGSGGRGEPRRGRHRPPGSARWATSHISLIREGARKGFCPRT